MRHWIRGGLAVGLAVFLMTPAAARAGELATRLAAAMQSLGQEAGLVPMASVQATAFGGTPAVGALFTATGSSGLGNHFCTASVVDSPHGDVVLTAAHCVSGAAHAAMVFAPGYHDGAAPYGVWRVTRVIVDRNWISSANPDDDFAFLVVSRPGTGPVQAVTGGERLGLGRPPGQRVRVIGYPDGAGAPVECENRARPFGPAQLEFDCGGYTDGTSGSPLVASVNPVTGLGTVIGVIGGYQRGGVTASVSYADQLGTGVAALYQEATARS